MIQQLFIAVNDGLAWLEREHELAYRIAGCTIMAACILAGAAIDGGI